MKTTLAAALLIGTISLPSWAVNISVTDVWTRTTVPGQKVSGGYLKIQSDEDAQLVAVSSSAVPRVEIHEMKMDGNVMRMREVKAIDLPKGKIVSLEPGGFHLMLMNLQKPIAAGDMVPLKLVVKSGGKQQTVEVEAEARTVDGSAMQQHHH